MRDDGRAARAADQADPERNFNFSRPWITRPGVTKDEAVTGPDEPSATAHPLSWHAKPKPAPDWSDIQRQIRASWWTR